MNCKEEVKNKHKTEYFLLKLCIHGVKIFCGISNIILVTINRNEEITKSTWLPPYKIIWLIFNNHLKCRLS